MVFLPVLFAIGIFNSSITAARISTVITSYQQEGSVSATSIREHIDISSFLHDYKHTQYALNTWLAGSQRAVCFICFRDWESSLLNIGFYHLEPISRCRIKYIIFHSVYSMNFLIWKQATNIFEQNIIFSTSPRHWNHLSHKVTFLTIRVMLAEHEIRNAYTMQNMDGIVDKSQFTVLFWDLSLKKSSSTIQCFVAGVKQ